MDKSKINSSMLFKDRTGTLLILLSNKYGKLNFYDRGRIINGYAKPYLGLEFIRDDLTLNTPLENNDYDIIAMKQLDSQSVVIDRILQCEDIPYREWDWVREPVKEMTLQQIKNILGYDIKIIE